MDRYTRMIADRCQPWGTEDEYDWTSQFLGLEGRVLYDENIDEQIALRNHIQGRKF